MRCLCAGLDPHEQEEGTPIVVVVGVFVVGVVVVVVVVVLKS